MDPVQDRGSVAFVCEVSGLVIGDSDAGCEPGRLLSGTCRKQGWMKGWKRSDRIRERSDCAQTSEEE